jgi:hypothetical protein
MTRPEFDAALIRFDACSEAVDWTREHPKLTPARLWATCQRADWMLWLAGRAGIDRKLLVLAACDCAETALKYVPRDEQRPAEAVSDEEFVEVMNQRDEARAALNTLLNLLESERPDISEVEWDEAINIGKQALRRTSCCDGNVG